jgi:hypothetical protein
MKPTVAIVGGGLSSMYAIMACRDRDIEPTVFVKDSNPSFGAIFLYSLPTSIAWKFKQYNIQFNSKGVRDSYIMKQWKDAPMTYLSSFPAYPRVETGYDPSEVYTYVFKNLIYKPLDRPLDSRDLVRLAEEYEIVFHSFVAGDFLDVFVVRSAIFPILEIPYDDRASCDTITYDGSPESIIARKSWLFGREFLELSRRINYSQSELQKMFNPKSIFMARDLIPGDDYSQESEGLGDRIIPIGRIARLNRAELAHETYDVVIEALNEYS